MTFAVQLPKENCEMQSQLLSHFKFVLPCRAKKAQYAPASSSLGVLPESSTWPLPAGSTATWARVAKVKCSSTSTIP
jgi:hypothetical protein